MDFILKQNLIKIYKDKYSITDTAGNECFFVESSISFTKKFILSDFNGNPLLYMKKRYFRWFHRWDVKNTDKETLFYIKRRRIPFTRKYKVVNVKDSSTSTYPFVGHIFGRNYNILRVG